MKTLFLTLILAGGLLNSLPLAAQVPQSLNYQGRVAVNGAAFTGTGQFRFALVDGAGTALWSSHASATANVAVSGGLYTVRLGDTSLTNMAAVPSALFSNGDLRLRVWFNDGVNGLQQLAPDQRLAPVGYAHRAASVDSVPASAIAPGFIQPSQMATAWQAGYYDDEYNSVPATGGPVTITFPNPFESPPAVELGDGTTALNVTTTGFTINVPPRDIEVDDGSPATSNVGRWRDAILVDSVAIDEAEFIHGGGRGFGRYTFETDDGCSAWSQFDDFVVHFLELAGIAAAFLTQPMQTAQEVWSNGHVLGFGVDEV